MASAHLRFPRKHSSRQQPDGLSTASAGPTGDVIWADYYQNPMARHYSPAWLVATATPRRRAYGLRKRSGSLAIFSAIRRASSLVRRFIVMRRPDSSSKYT
jgi:hypothetical protein